jgi:hypothetical protein
MGVTPIDVAYPAAEGLSLRVAPLIGVCAKPRPTIH